MEIRDFVVAQIEEISENINSMESELHSIYSKKNKLSSDIEKLKETIIEKQNEALFRPQELDETNQIDEIMREYSSFDDTISRIKQCLSKDKERLGMFQKILNYIRDNERKNNEAASVKKPGKNGVKQALGLDKVGKEIYPEDKDSVSAVKEEWKRKNMELFIKLQKLKGNLNFAKKICLSDTRRCMMEIDKINNQIDVITNELN